MKIIKDGPVVYCFMKTYQNDKKYPVYVGSSMSCFRPLGLTRRNGEVVEEGDRLGLWFFDSTEDAVLFEANLIELLKPRGNRNNIKSLLSENFVNRPPDMTIDVGEEFLIKRKWPVEKQYSSVSKAIGVWAHKTFKEKFNKKLRCKICGGRKYAGSKKYCEKCNKSLLAKVKSRCCTLKSGEDYHKAKRIIYKEELLKMKIKTMEIQKDQLEKKWS